MNTMWKHLMNPKSGILERPLTYTYLKSCRRFQHLTIGRKFSQRYKGKCCQREAMMVKSRICLMSMEKCLLNRESHCWQKSNYLLKTEKHLTEQPMLPNDHFSRKQNYSSSIFVSDRHSDISSAFNYDLDLEEKLVNIELLKVNLHRRGLDINIDQLEKDYAEYLQLGEEKVKLELKRENIASQIAKIVGEQKQSGTKTKDQTSQMKCLKEEGKITKSHLKQLMVKYWDVEERVMLLALSLPSNLSTDVPDDLKVLQEHFEEKKPTLPLDHEEVLRQSDMVRLRNVGHKAYYLTGRLAVLEQELVTYFSTQLRSQHIHQMAAPEMFKAPVVESGGINVMDPSSVYRLQHKLGTSEMSDRHTDHMFLHGTSHLSFLSYFARMELSCEDLPIQMFAVGRNYIPENVERKSLPGLYGVLQSIKVCMCAVCKSRESSAEVVEQFTNLLTKLY
ncbi:uncharacterized protein LOC132742990, partial [Ruditapes philippinarum]|uniref:uncharacterized protein LOC132742990 n=1 Tax=Ruditapes philippinarum TaxID=129788 RepID=UPI00295A5942